jgi:hypothetical protein
MLCFSASKGLCCYHSLVWRLLNIALTWHGKLQGLFQGKQILVCFEERFQTMLLLYYTHAILPANTLYSSYWFCPM